MDINITNFQAELKNKKTQLFFNFLNDNVEIDTVYLTKESPKYSDEAKRTKITYVEKSGTMGVIHLTCSHDMISRFDIMLARIKKFIDNYQDK